MSFKNLEERFNARKTDIYNQFTNPEALVTILPDSPQSKQKIKDDIRLAPVSVSLTRDKLRIRRLNSSNTGQQFNRTQLVLQTQNTFAETRAYNPANLLLNGIPSINIPRHIGFSLLTKEYAGALQSDTVASFGSVGPFAGFVKGLVSTVLSPITALNAKPKIILSGVHTDDTNIANSNERFGIFYERPEDVFGTGLPVNQPLAERGQKKSAILFQNLEQIADFAVGKLPLGMSTGAPTLRYYRENFGLFSRINPLAKIPYISYVGNFNTLSTVASKFIVLQGDKTKTYDATDFRFAVESDKGVSTFQQSFNVYGGQEMPMSASLTNITGIYTFRQFEQQNNTNGYFVRDTKQAGSETTYLPSEETNGGVVLRTLSGPSRFKDPINLTYDLRSAAETTQPSDVTLPQNKIDYKSIYAPTGSAAISADSNNKRVENSTDDAIKFEFRDVKGQNPVQFRAFISNLKENIKPEFTEQKYLGRIERYVTYNGVKRQITLSFNIIAYSQEEIYNVWKRVNYLSGLAFPKLATRAGFMVPPLFKITIGGIYDMQPAYIDSLNYDFIDNDTTFDIDVGGGVPKYIKVDMSLTLMEKRTKFFDSPFYAITEQMQGTADIPTVVDEVDVPAPQPARPEQAAASPTGGAPVEGAASADTNARPPAPRSSAPPSPGNTPLTPEQDAARARFVEQTEAARQAQNRPQLVGYTSPRSKPVNTFTNEELARRTRQVEDLTTPDTGMLGWRRDAQYESRVSSGQIAALSREQKILDDEILRRIDANGGVVPQELRNNFGGIVGDVAGRNRERVRAQRLRAAERIRSGGRRGS